ncbi:MULTISPECIES: hypothetical protein [unclassified Paraburkholderia]|uniref:hypothetical protein n=1 Tax=unclassified Paraburkholderia TaxID=2615204 RepID=UPI001616AC33|nr:MULTISPECIES: hypothetical protein [unclassified Paraburkholderia]MBB5443271.1 hypothetical protein [Paraburkholderia sp. WSM4177]MBB5483123.1 hypothetical protein [Paraburkholderia sp. WSM4180]
MSLINRIIKNLGHYDAAALDRLAREIDGEQARRAAISRPTPASSLIPESALRELLLTWLVEQGVDRESVEKAWSRRESGFAPGKPR